VEIPKPDGGKRQLGIPTVIDRMVQQALVQILQPIFEQTFSDSSYGFRPGRNAHRELKFLGFSFYWSKEGVRIRIHEKPLKRLGERLKALTSRKRSVTVNFTASGER
jgi:hypothetical protein